MGLLGNLFKIADDVVSLPLDVVKDVVDGELSLDRTTLRTKKTIVDTLTVLDTSEDDDE